MTDDGIHILQCKQACYTDFRVLKGVVNAHRLVLRRRQRTLIGRIRVRSLTKPVH
jgi:hypothetical protein